MRMSTGTRSAAMISFTDIIESAPIGHRVAVDEADRVSGRLHLDAGGTRSAPASPGAPEGCLGAAIGHASSAVPRKPPTLPTKVPTTAGAGPLVVPEQPRSAPAT